MLWRCVSSVAGALLRIAEYYPDVASHASVKTTSNESSARELPLGASTVAQLHPCGSSNCFRASVGLAIGKYVHNLLHSELRQSCVCTAIRIGRPGPHSRSLRPKALPYSFPWRAQVVLTWLLARDLSSSGLLCVSSLLCGPAAGLRPLLCPISAFLSVLLSTFRRFHVYRAPIYTHNAPQGSATPFHSSLWSLPRVLQHSAHAHTSIASLAASRCVLTPTLPAAGISLLAGTSTPALSCTLHASPDAFSHVPSSPSARPKVTATAVVSARSENAAEVEHCGR